MRVLVMANTPPNPNAGASGTELQTVTALRELGHDVDTVWADDLSHFIRHGNTHQLIELPIAYRRAMLKRLSKKRYDVVHVSQPHGYLAARALEGRSQRPVFVHRSHGFEPRVRHDLAHWRRALFHDDRSRLRQAISRVYDRALEANNRWITAFADGHIVSASQCADFLVSRYAVRPDRVAVIHQAPPPSFQATPVCPMTPDRLRRLLYVGQFAFLKAPMILVRAVETILDRNPDTTMTWVCDSRHHAAARAFFERQELLARVSFLPWQPQDDLIRIFDSHGVFLFPSFFEGFGKAFIEAMSRGLIVIASDNGGMRDIIRHGQNGLLHPTGDSARLTALALGAIAAPEEAQTLSAEARTTSLHYTWLRVARETSAFYESLIAMRRP